MHIGIVFFYQHDIFFYMSSPFLNEDRIIENKYAFAIYDSYPVTKGHSLVIPKRQIKEIFELNKEEYESCFELVRKVKDLLITKFKPEGFNIGVNCGEVAGQTIFHAHIHVIPRYKGDVPNPRGGVRNIIPGKGDY